MVPVRGWLWRRKGRDRQTDGGDTARSAPRSGCCWELHCPFDLGRSVQRKQSTRTKETPSSACPLSPLSTLLSQGGDNARGPCRRGEGGASQASPSSASGHMPKAGPADACRSPWHLAGQGLCGHTPAVTSACTSVPLTDTDERGVPGLLGCMDTPACHQCVFRQVLAGGCISKRFAACFFF